MTRLGILLLLAGAVGFVRSAPKMDEARSFLGQVARSLSTEQAADAQWWQTIYHGSIVAFVLGAVLLVAGRLGARRR